MQEQHEASAPTTDTAAPTQSAFEVALHHLEGRILEQSLRVGDRLPPERDLAVQLGVSRPAVREAIRTLQAQGVLTSRVGSGAQAGTHIISERSQALGRLLRLQVALSQFPLDEVVSTRIALERTSATMAAQRQDDEARQQLEPLLARMDQARAAEEFNQADTDFHVCIAQLAGNSLLGDLTEAVRESLRLPILAAERRLDDWEDFRGTLHQQHAAIAHAIAGRDATAAADLMEEHIRHAYGVLPLSLE